jgi:hypothetical protein
MLMRLHAGSRLSLRLDAAILDQFDLPPSQRDITTMKSPWLRPHSGCPVLRARAVCSTVVVEALARDQVRQGRHGLVFKASVDYLGAFVLDGVVAHACACSTSGWWREARNGFL